MATTEGLVTVDGYNTDASPDGARLSLAGIPWTQAFCEHTNVLGDAFRKKWRARFVPTLDDPAIDSLMYNAAGILCAGAGRRDANQVLRGGITLRRYNRDEVVAYAKGIMNGDYVPVLHSQRCVAWVKTVERTGATTKYQVSRRGPVRIYGAHIHSPPSSVLFSSIPVSVKPYAAEPADRYVTPACRLDKPNITLFSDYVVIHTVWLILEAMFVTYPIYNYANVLPANIVDSRRLRGTIEDVKLLDGNLTNSEDSLAILPLSTHSKTLDAVREYVPVDEDMWTSALKQASVLNAGPHDGRGPPGKKRKTSTTGGVAHAVPWMYGAHKDGTDGIARTLNEVFDTKYTTCKDVVATFEAAEHGEAVLPCETALQWKESLVNAVIERAATTLAAHVLQTPEPVVYRTTDPSGAACDFPACARDIPDFVDTPLSVLLASLEHMCANVRPYHMKETIKESAPEQRHTLDSGLASSSTDLASSLEDRTLDARIQAPHINPDIDMRQNAGLEVFRVYNVLNRIPRPVTVIARHGMYVDVV